MRPSRCFFALINAFVVVAVTLALMPGAWAESKFKVLAGVDGGLWSRLTLDSQGNVYGVTLGGGTNSDGTVFELTPGKNGQWTQTILHNFNGDDGYAPNGNLVFDAAGNIYGTTQLGGAHYKGTVFELTPGTDGWTLTTLHNFCAQYGCPDGCSPDAGVVLDQPGNLYGTAACGPDNLGIAFELTPGSGSWTESIVYVFGSKPQVCPLCADATSPDAPLVFDKAGNLYGASYHGGDYWDGAVSELSAGSVGDRNESVLWQFDGTDGQAPSGVILDPSGNLYGSAHGGPNFCDGGSCGIVFKLTPAGNGGWQETVVHAFGKIVDGFEPNGGVVLDTAGNLYGTTALGGGSSNCYDGCGVVYELMTTASGGWKYRTLHRFHGGDGQLPDGGLAIDGKGNLYGVADYVVFEVTP